MLTTLLAGLSARSRSPSVGGNEIHVGITSLPVFAVETRRFGIGDKFHLLARQHVAPPLADHPVYGRIGAGSYRGKRRSPVGGHIIVTGRGKGDPAFGQTAEPALGKVMAVTGDEIIGQPPTTILTTSAGRSGRGACCAAAV